MKLRNLIPEGPDHERRSKPVDLDFVIDWFIKHYGTSITDEHLLVSRSLPNVGPTAFIQPSKYNRVSRNTTNHYTLLIDSDPKWSRYPKRSKSIICIYSKSRYRYVIIPKPDAIIGICPYYDLWVSFKTMQDLGMDAASFNYSLIKLYKEISNKSDLDKPISGKQIRDALDKYLTRESMEELVQSAGPHGMWRSAPALARAYLEYTTDNETFSEFVSRVLDPTDNGFKVQKGFPFKLSGSDNREIWTDSDCIMIREGTVDTFVREVLSRAKKK